MNLWMFDISSFIVTAGFCVVFFVIIVSAVRSVIQWSKNNASPVLTVDAKVVTKRENVSHHHNGNNMGMHTSSTYYATFEVESGDRMELQVSGSEYGMLVEGDRGKLTFQGTRYKGFARSG